MLKSVVLLVAAAASSLAGEVRSHFVGATLDIYVDSSVEELPDVPGIPATARHFLLVSVKTKDESAAAIMAYIMVRLSDGTRTAFTAVRRNNGDRLVLFRFPIGALRATEVVDIHVDNLHKTFADAVSKVF